jgi:hypothetical protein
MWSLLRSLSPGLALPLSLRSDDVGPAAQHPRGKKMNLEDFYTTGAGRSPSGCLMVRRWRLIGYFPILTFLIRLSV